jgi:adenylyltransferase/sulfurtransferase
MNDLPELSRAEIGRYLRHIVLPQVGEAGQRKLKAASVAVVGAGGLGAPLGLYLAAAGVGRLGIVDFDAVDASNLQRQIIHGTRDVGRAKTASAQERLTDVNPHVEVVVHDTRLTAANAMEILRGYDIVADGTDNFPTRYLVNDACVLLGKPNVFGSVFRFEGQASVFNAAGGPCYRCVYPEPPPPGEVPSCAEGGVLGVLPGIVGTIQATETIKLILRDGETLAGRLLVFDAWAMRFHEVRLRKNPDCPVCGERATITSLIDYEAFCGVGAAGAGGSTMNEDRISAVELKRLIALGRDVQLIDVREPHENAFARLPHSTLIPLREIVRRAAEIDPAREAIVYCRSGIRSAHAIRQLKAAGYPGRLANLEGGILAWSREVDPSVPTY